MNIDKLLFIDKINLLNKAYELTHTVLITAIIKRKKYKLTQIKRKTLSYIIMFNKLHLALLAIRSEILLTRLEHY